MAAAQAHVARTVAGLMEGRSTLEDLGYGGASLGVLEDRDMLAGIGSLLGAVYLANIVVDEWEGIETEEGEAVELSLEALKAAFRLGTPSGGIVLLEPFLGWMDRPRVPIGADCARLRKLAEWEFGEGARFCEDCVAGDRACVGGGINEDGSRCPRIEHAPLTVEGRAAWKAANRGGAWLRGGMNGALLGLNYADALTIAQAEGVTDTAALVRCFGAIEGGALKAEADRARKDQ